MKRVHTIISCRGDVIITRKVRTRSMRMLAFSHLLCATFAVAAGAMPNVVSTAAGFATLQIHADVPWDGSLADNESRLSFTSIDEASGKSQTMSCPAPQQGQVRIFNGGNSAFTTPVGTLVSTRNAASWPTPKLMSCGKRGGVDKDGSIDVASSSFDGCFDMVLADLRAWPACPRLSATPPLLFA
jgi:hypothetical protein